MTARHPPTLSHTHTYIVQTRLSLLICHRPRHVVVFCALECDVDAWTPVNIFCIHKLHTITTRNSHSVSRKCCGNIICQNPALIPSKRPTYHVVSSRRMPKKTFPIYKQLLILKYSVFIFRASLSGYQTTQRRSSKRSIVRLSVALCHTTRPNTLFDLFRLIN